MFHLELTFKDIGIGFVANRDEDTLYRYLLRTAINGAFDANFGDAGIIALYFIKGVIP